MAEWSDYARVIPAINAFMTWQDRQNDAQQLNKDWLQMQSDPNFTPELSKYRDAATGLSVLEAGQKVKKSLKDDEIVNQFGPAYSRFQADVSQNPDTRRAEILAFQTPEDLNAIVKGSATFPHLTSLTGTPINEEQQVKDQQTQVNLAKSLQAEAGLSQLFGPSATPEKYPGTLGNIPFDAPLAYEWAAQNGVPAATVQPILEQFRKNYDTTYGPPVSNTLQVGNAQKTVRGNFNALGEFKKFDELATHPPQPKTAGAMSNKPPSGYRFNENGDLAPIPGGPADPGGKAGKILPAGQLEALADMQQLQSTLREAAKLHNTGKAVTGPVVGRKQTALALVDQATPGFVDLSQKLQTVQNIMLKLRSGAAVTESEYARFVKEFPTVNDSPKTFKQKMDNSIKYATGVMESKIGMYKEGGYRTPGQDNGTQQPTDLQAAAAAEQARRKGGK